MSLTVQGGITCLIFAIILVAMGFIAIAHIQHQKQEMQVYEVLLENGEVVKWGLPGHHVTEDRVHLRHDHKRIKATIR